jgi:endonuclease YncB( thermonuclease family)
MSFGKLVVLSMIGAFSAGVGYSYVAEKHGFPLPGKDMPTDTAASTKTEYVSKSMQIVTTMPLTEKMKPTPEVQPASVEPYAMCSGSKRFHCVVDGDTIWHLGTKIRIADIDTPEVGEPKCSSEAALGARATKRLLQLVNAGPFEMQPWAGRDEDKYGRKLRVFVRDGRSLGDILVSEGLARTWSGRREPWC